MSTVSYEVQIKRVTNGSHKAFYEGVPIPSAPPPQHFKDGDTAILSCKILMDDKLGARFHGPWQWRLVKL